MINPDAVLFETHIHDWRIADESPEELTGRQTERWLTQVFPGPYSGLFLKFAAPDGTERCVSIEIDKGNVVVRPYRGEEPDARMTVARDASFVEANVENGPMGRKVIRYDQDGAELHSGEIPASMDTI